MQRYLVRHSTTSFTSFFAGDAVEAVQKALDSMAVRLRSSDEILTASLLSQDGYCWLLTKGDSVPDGHTVTVVRSPEANLLAAYLSFYPAR